MDFPVSGSHPPLGFGWLWLRLRDCISRNTRGLGTEGPTCRSLEKIQYFYG